MSECGGDQSVQTSHSSVTAIPARQGFRRQIVSRRLSKNRQGNRTLLPMALLLEYQMFAHQTHIAFGFCLSSLHDSMNKSTEATLVTILSICRSVLLGLLNGGIHCHRMIRIL